MDPIPCFWGVSFCGGNSFSLREAHGLLRLIPTPPTAASRHRRVNRVRSFSTPSRCSVDLFANTVRDSTRRGVRLSNTVHFCMTPKTESPECHEYHPNPNHRRPARRFRFHLLRRSRRPVLAAAPHPKPGKRQGHDPLGFEIHVCDAEKLDRAPRRLPRMPLQSQWLKVGYHPRSEVGPCDLRSLPGRESPGLEANAGVAPT